MNFFGFKIMSINEYNNFIDKYDFAIATLQEQLYRKAMELRSERLQRTLDRLERNLMDTINEEIIYQEMLLNIENQL